MIMGGPNIYKLSKSLEIIKFGLKQLSLSTKRIMIGGSDIGFQRLLGPLIIRSILILTTQNMSKLGMKKGRKIGSLPVIPCASLVLQIFCCLMEDKCILCICSKRKGQD